MHINYITGFQAFTSQSLTAAQGVSTSLLKRDGVFANAVEISVGGSTGAIRFRDDGTAPTASVGARLPAGLQPYLYQGDIHKLQFIVDTVAGNADVSMRYLQVGDGT